MTRPVIDCHSDVLIDVFRRRQAGERNVLTRIHLPAYIEGGVVASVCTVGGDGASQSPLGEDAPYQSAVAKLDELQAEVAESEGKFAVATSAADVEACIERGTFAIIPALEGASPFQGDLALVEDLFDRGVRVVGLTWNTRNELAVGTDAGEGGLSELGEQAIALMNDLGVLIDLSHATAATFADVVRITRAPVYASHSNAKAVWDHERNLDDEQLSAIASTAGAVGLVFCPNFIADQPVTLDQLLDHLEYLVQTVGVDSVVIGADFIDYAVEEMMIEAAKHPDLYDLDTIRYPAGAETVKSMQNVVAGMAGRGFDTNAIDKVASGNFLRLLQTTQTLAEARRSAQA